MSIIRVNILSPAQKIIKVPVFSGIVPAHTHIAADITDFVSAVRGVVQTGWAQYASDEYTEMSPLFVPANTTITIPNNGAIVIEEQLNGNGPFYDGTNFKITPDENGDAYVISIRFKAKASLVNSYVRVGLDIGGLQGIIIEEMRVFLLDAGTEHPFNIVFPIYSRATFLANGGLVKLTAGFGDVYMYDIVYVIEKVHESIL